MVEMKVQAILFDVHSNAPVVILKDKTGKKFLPIWIGHFEANAIEIELKGIKTPRPLTHDLFMKFLEIFKAEIKQITVCDLQANTYFATISIVVNKKIIDLDARPSDAIAIALKSKAPIYATEWVLKEAPIFDIENNIEDEKEKYAKLLESINPDDVKYKH